MLIGGGAGSGDVGKLIGARPNRGLSEKKTGDCPQSLKAPVLSFTWPNSRPMESFLL